jgi:hypothetical protein
LGEFAALPTFPAVVLTPIHDLTIAQGRFALDATTELVVIREDREASRAFDYTFAWPFAAAEVVRPATVALRQEVELPREGTIDFSPAMDRADKLVGALRLAGLSELAPGANVIAAHPPAFLLPALQVKAFRMGRVTATALTIAPPQELGDRGDELRTLFAKLDASKDTTLTFAVRRFNDSDERARDEDVIFDCFSALEALFAGGATSEITYRLALRVSKVVRSTTAERVELFKRLKKLYATRSKVLHGGTVPPAKLAADAAEAKELLRASILAWLDSGSRDSEGLDELLLS